MIDFILSAIYGMTELLFLVFITMALLPLKISQEFSARGIKARYVKSENAHIGYDLVLLLMQIIWIAILMWWVAAIVIKYFS